MANLVLTGYLQASGDGCGCSSGGSGLSVPLAFLCGGSSYYQTILNAGLESPIRINTLGIVGAEFVDLPILEQLTAIEFLFMQSDQPVMIRVGALPATLLGAAIGFPIATSGGETFIFEIDGVAVTYTAGVGSFANMAALLNALNGAAAAAGLATPRFAAVGSAIQITGVVASRAGNITIGAGTLNATLGFVTAQEADGAGEDTVFSGLYMVQFQRYPYAPTRIQISGQANVSIVAAGRTSP